LHTRVRERVRGAFSPNQDLTQNTFELCLLCTATENFTLKALIFSGCGDE